MGTTMDSDRPVLDTSIVLREAVQLAAVLLS